MMSNYSVFKVLLLSLALVGLVGCHVVDLDENGEPIIPMSAADAELLKNMTPNAIADKLWPSIKKDAQHNAVALSSIEKDSSVVSFVRFQGVVSRFDESKLKTSLVVNSAGYDIALQFGKIIKGNSIRDAASMISFNQFKNQIQFAQLSKSLNKKAIAQVVKPDSSWVDQPVSVLAAVTIKANKVTHAVPLEISKEGM